MLKLTSRFLVLAAVLSSASAFAQLATRVSCEDLLEKTPILTASYSDSKINIIKTLEVETAGALVGKINAGDYLTEVSAASGTSYMTFEVTEQMSAMPDGVVKAHARLITPELLHPGQTSTGMLQIELTPSDSAQEPYPFWSTMLNCSGQ